MQRSANSSSRPISTSHQLIPSTSHFITVHGTRIRYVEEGEDNPGIPLLMVHGYNGSAEYFYPHTIPGLAAERRVLALDLPGCGFSDKMREYSLQAYVNIITGFLDAKGVDQADLLGHSMGGQLAIAAAAAHPERFAHLVLVDSSGLPELVRGQYLTPLKMLTDASLRHVRLYPTYIKITMRARSQLHGLRVLWSDGVGAILESLAVPTLITWGSHDRIVPIKHGKWMARHIPNARFVVFPGAGHMPFYQHPEEFNRIVLSFLRNETPHKPEETHAE